MHEPSAPVAGDSIKTGASLGLPLPGAPSGLPLANFPAARPSSSRRRRLWEIPHRFHCPIVGTCFECDELRTLMAKVMHLPRETSDFVLHTTAVGNCEERTRLSELLHKTLEKRFRLSIRQFSACKTEAELKAAWGQACREGSRIPAALWAAWTHPACGARLEQEIYGDIHMIQHQVGSGTRADLQAMRSLAEENRELRHQLAVLRCEAQTLRRDKAKAVHAVSSQLSELRRELAASEAWGTALQRRLDAWQAGASELEERQSLAARLAAAERRNAELKAQREQQDKELLRLREFARYAEETFEALAREDDSLAKLPAGDLSGKCVLCVGGRAGAVRSYRNAVEQCGGRFLHHDGGLEESLHRIDGALAAADIVICQAGCISHNAYWRVKDLCKRTGKPCLFVRNGSATSFGRVVGEAGRGGAVPD